MEFLYQYLEKFRSHINDDKSIKYLYKIHIYVGKLRRICQSSNTIDINNSHIRILMQTTYNNIEHIMKGIWQIYLWNNQYSC